MVVKDISFLCQGVIWLRIRGGGWAEEKSHEFDKDAALREGPSREPIEREKSFIRGSEDVTSTRYVLGKQVRATNPPFVYCQGFRKSTLGRGSRR